MTGEESRVTVLVADDQQVVRDGLALLLGLIDGVEVVGTAVDGADALRQVAAADPDVALMDLRMPHVDGVEATRRIVAEHPRTRVVVLTTYADDESVFTALRAGARGFLTKDSGAEEIRRAILAVAGGDAQLDPSVQRRVLEALTGPAGTGAAGVGAAGVGAGASGGSGGGPWGAAGGGRRAAAPPPPPELARLTAREHEVLREIALGRSNTEISDRLFVSEATVKTHVNHVLAKTGCRDRAQLVAWAYRTGVVPHG